jgi:hypothetical protein
MRALLRSVHRFVLDWPNCQRTTQAELDGAVDELSAIPKLSLMFCPYLNGTEKRVANRSRLVPFGSCGASD